MGVSFCSKNTPKIALMCNFMLKLLQNGQKSFSGFSLLLLLKLLIPMNCLSSSSADSYSAEHDAWTLIPLDTHVGSGDFRGYRVVVGHTTVVFPPVVLTLVTARPLNIKCFGLHIYFLDQTWVF